MAGDKSILKKISDSEFFIIEETQDGTKSKHYIAKKGKYKLLTDDLIDIRKTECDYLWIIKTEDDKEQIYNSKLRRKGKYSVSKIGKFFDFGGKKMAQFEDYIGNVTLLSFMDETGNMPMTIEDKNTGEQITTDTIYFDYESTRNKLLRDQYSDKRAKQLTL